MEDGEWILHNEYKENIRMKNWNSSGKELVTYSYINIYICHESQLATLKEMM
jgi:hypothetical protein